MVKKEREAIEINDSSLSPDESGTPLEPIFYLKSRDQLKETEQKEECFIVEFVLGNDFSMLNLGTSDSEDLDDADIRVIAEKGQVFHFIDIVVKFKRKYFEIGLLLFRIY